MAGIAVLMIVSQLGKVSGVEDGRGFGLSEVRFFVVHLGEVHRPTLLVAAGTFAVLVALYRLLPRWPGPLIAMVLAAAAVAVLDVDQMGSRPSAVSRAGCPPLDSRLLHHRLQHPATGRAPV